MRLSPRWAATRSAICRRSAPASSRCRRQSVPRRTRANTPSTRPSRRPPRPLVSKRPAQRMTRSTPSSGRCRRSRGTPRTRMSRSLGPPRSRSSIPGSTPRTRIWPAASSSERASSAAIRRSTRTATAPRSPGLPRRRSITPSASRAWPTTMPRFFRCRCSTRMALVSMPTLSPAFSGPQTTARTSSSWASAAPTSRPRSKTR